MKRSKTLYSTICFIISLVILFPYNSQLKASEDHDYWYENETGNTDYQRIGDAVYREGGSMNPWNHAGLLFTENEVMQIMNIDDDVLQKENLSDFKTNYDKYYGAHYNPDMSKEDRTKIIETASQIWARRSTINYMLMGQIDGIGAGLNWDGTVDDIDELRCDGFVEVCYELNNIEVWGKNQQHYLIQNYAREHNNAPNLEPDPNTEVCPVVQRGGPGLIYTKLRASSPIAHNFIPPASTQVIQGEILFMNEKLMNIESNLDYAYSSQCYVITPNNITIDYSVHSAELKGGEIQKRKFVIRFSKTVPIGTYTFGIKFFNINGTIFKDDSFKVDVIKKSKKTSSLSELDISSKAMDYQEIQTDGWKISILYY
ncbi:hypothetical protein GMMP1_130039 [Candidatus Magnetomoraceae bacterium gMMP-1]